MSGATVVAATIVVNEAFQCVEGQGAWRVDSVNEGQQGYL